ncbi:hypothetical protein V2J09_015047 [Rumex salicifolius]
MGKSRKFSKGPSNGFVPEYRHAVETMAESEGLGSSGRVDAEPTLSQDSCMRRQKCIRLNGDSYNQFGVPVQVLSLSKISRSDRKGLEFKLRRELDQVRILQKRVASMNFDTVIKSTSSVYSVGKKRPPIQSIVPNQHPSGKKQALEDRNGNLMKRGIPQNAVPANGVYSMLMKQCEGLLTQLMRHKSGWVFNKPVDVIELNIPDYFTIIKNPMDFGTIKGKFAAGKYSSPLEFAADVRLTFSNAMIYNPSQNNVHIMAKGLSKYFESKWKTIEKKIPGDVQFMSLEKDASHVRSSVIDLGGPPMKKKKMPPGSGTLKPLHASKKMPDAFNKKMPDAFNKKMPDAVNKRMPDAVNKKMTDALNKKMSEEEKQKLSMELESLMAELPDNIIDFLKNNSSSAEQTADDEIEIDFLALNEDTLFKLRKLLDDYLTEKKKLAKAEQPQIELHNEGGSNKSLLRGKGNDAVEEDIDIGGNDSPILSFPPIEIEKDAAHENLKGSSSSSSSSSGSSSSDSDSDSGSSSGSENEGAKVPNHVNSVEATMKADETVNHKQVKTKDPEIIVETVGAPADEQNAVTVPSSAEGGSHSEGESAPFERQVSPEKVYRAALLKSRFADTIFKAQEKTLDEGVKRDPEKLRIEREKLERMQREEKAKLQAAALAAEAARKKAEAEAAAEARRKREMEREAARLALQKMEKTVHINESCEFLENLEMLRADPPGDLCILTKDANLEHSENMLDSFKLQSSSNPLEQLGLYMKQDDDEDEDIVADPLNPQSSSNPLEQLGLYMKQDDDEEEDMVADPSRLTKNSENMESLKLQSSNNPLEQLGLFMKQDDDVEEDMVTDPSGLTKDSENMGSLKLQSSNNPVEQLGLHMKQDDDNSDEEEDAPGVSSLTKDASLEASENILGSFKPEISNNSLEQLGLHMKQDDDNSDQEEDAPDVSSLTKETKDANPEPSENILGGFKSQTSINSLEQLGLYMKQDDDDEDEEVDIISTKEADEHPKQEDEEADVVAEEAPPCSTPNDVENAEIE